MMIARMERSDEKGHGEMEASALIIARPGPLRDGLQALVDTMPLIRALNVLNDVSSALGGETGGSPALVLLDADLSNDRVWLTVRRVKRKWPRARTIILAGSVEQQAEAEVAGADVVLLEGFPAGKLVAAIVKLLPQPVL